MKPDENEGTTKPVKKGYGKRPLWQWVVVYLVVAVVVYGAIYLIFFHPSGSGMAGGYSY